MTTEDATAAAGFAMSSVFLVVGALLATDYKGISTRHVRISLSLARSVNPFGKRPAGERLERKLARLVVVERVIGALFLVFGAVAASAALPSLCG